VVEFITYAIAGVSLSDAKCMGGETSRIMHCDLIRFAVSGTQISAQKGVRAQPFNSLVRSYGIQEDIEESF